MVWPHANFRGLRRWSRASGHQTASGVAHAALALGATSTVPWGARLRVGWSLTACVCEGFGDCSKRDEDNETKKLKTEDGQNSVGNLRWKNRRRDAFKESGSLEQYPYYGMPVATLLELKAWEPHQKLLAAGSVRECTADDDVIFVSHQWLGFEHPDPKHDQLRALQRMIRRLLSGELTVESNATLQVLYGLQQTTTADEWARRLPRCWSGLTTPACRSLPRRTPATRRSRCLHGTTRTTVR